MSIFSSGNISRGLGALAASGCLLLSGVWLSVHGEESTAINEIKPAAGGSPLEKKLGGHNRILAYLSTDKPVYRAGEKVYFRGVVLDAMTNIPADPVRGQLTASLTVTGPKGDIVARIVSRGESSTAGLSWEVPAGQAGGQYTATLTVNNCAPTVRKFEIRAYAPPRLKTQVEFVRKGYGPGDTVSGVVNVMRAEGGIPSGAKVTAIARLDGAEVFRNDALAVDTQGNCSTSFKLPAEIAVGDGTLAFLIEDGGVVETASKTIPILLQNLDVSFYPEGGDLIAGLPCRVYVQARRPDGKPADIEGLVMPTGGKEWTRTAPVVRTAHEGRGVFEITPTEDTETVYAMALSKPSGITKEFRLPVVKKSGAMIRANKESYPYDGPVSVTVNSTADSGAAKVTLCKREAEITSAALEPGKESTLLLDPKDYEGVLMATVWDAQGRPLAERLVFRQPKFAVNIKITPEAKEFVPGGKVKLNIETTDGKGSPVEAVVGLTVTDEAVLEMIDKREQAPRLPVMVYLENEVKDLADAHVYFDAKNPNAARDIDLLLGTQGWRRFILTRFDGLLKTDADAAKRALAWQRDALLRSGVDEFEEIDGTGEKGLAAAPVIKKLKVVAGFEGNIIGGNEKDLRHIAPAAHPVESKRAEAKPAGAILQRPGLDQDSVMRDVESIITEHRQYVAGGYVVSREYAHAARPNRQPNDRLDFSETLYWNAGIRTNPRDGKAQVEFDLSDSVTTFSVQADAFGNNGALGQTTTSVESLEPFYIEPKFPASVTAGDVIELPVALVNSTDKLLTKANLILKAEGLEAGAVEPLDIQPKQRARRIVRLATLKPGAYSVKISAAAGGYTDTVTRTLIVHPRGFPMEATAGGLLSEPKKFIYKLTIPQEVAAGSLSAVGKVFPSPLANMQEALNALLRQPYGCFEQTSSTTYPLVMAQQYFTTHQGVDPATIKKASELLAEGYKKLIGFECKEKGYEWFGGDPGHEALTAYGLLEFTEMSRLMPVDSKMLQRTRQWLLARRNGKGGFLRNDRALDSFGGAPIPTTNAYILWTLLESGEDPATLVKEIESVSKDAQESKDSYVIALAANILFLAKDNPAALTLCKRLGEVVEKDGRLGGAVTSITRSGGEALCIETTSLAILAWLRSQGEFAPQVERSMQWIFEACKAGRFGSTQSTILALKAINAYDQARAKPTAPGRVQLLIDGNAFGKAVNFTPDTQGVLLLPDFAAALAPGEHTLELQMTGGSEMPCGMEVKYFTNLPSTSKECDLTLTTALSAQKIPEGEPLEMAVTVAVGGQDAPTPIAIIGVPAGLEPRHDQLKELVKAGRIAAYEIVGQEIVLYWRALKAGQTLELPLSLQAAIPGSYTAPASRAYLYYTDEFKSWVAGSAIVVTPK